ncbi:putative transporter MCH2 [Zancudomyces culisetae]|uniref:Putative transporter MCH2 n=1 Tax=Zancudomyces culisetae TaxID=1213189 RepID=A0A1R1PIL7_ZANCU|nr:putative transporter MCH2 [Zancudomyces culisetae]|eukprot:OMH80753.1 putative transporter MCH2 [Zancudomyces culisetae]
MEKSEACSAKSVDQKSDIEKRSIDELKRDVPPPDTGYAWLVFISGILVFVTSFGAYNYFGLFQAYYLNKMFVTSSATSISWIGTISATLSLGLSVVYGPLVSTIGLRYTTFLGTASCVLGLFLASFSTEIWQLTLTQGVLFGFGCAIMANAAIFTTTMWFEKKRGMALSVVISSGCIGALASTPLVSFCLTKLGIAWTFRILTCITLVSMVLACVVYKPRVEVEVPKKVIRLETLKDPFIIYICLGSFLFQVGATVPMFYFPVSIGSVIPEGMSSDTVAQNAVILYCVFSFLGRVSLVKVAEFIGLLTVLIASHLITAVATMALWYGTNSYITYYVYYAIYGFFAGAIFVVAPVIFAKYYPLSRIAEVNGLQMSFLGLSYFVTTPILGLVFDHFGHRESYSQLIVICAVAFFFAGVCFVFLRNHVKKALDKSNRFFI